METLMTVLLDHVDPATQKGVRLAVERMLTSDDERVFAVVNQKGGAGKTTTAVTLAAIWAAWDLRVRIIDGDPQMGSATFWLPPQWPEGASPKDLRSVFFDEVGLDEATAPTTVPGVFIVPSDKTLGQVEYAQLADANLTVRTALKESRERFQITLYDCRPSLGVLTVAGLTAANEVIVPLGASGMDLPGLIELGETQETVRRRLNPDLRVAAVVVCHDSETILSRDVRNQLEEDYPEAVRWRIRRSVRVEEAPLAHEPLTTFAPDVTPTKDYAGLAAELITRGAR
jgi:chromosome partitioning protein